MTEALRVVIAPDSFKGTLRAQPVAAAIAEGWISERPRDVIMMIPQADGGEGTLEVIAAAVAAATRQDAGMVTGPDGRPTMAHWLELPGGIAVVELAVSSGIELMRVPDAMGATTRGLGQTIRAALDARPTPTGAAGSAAAGRTLLIALGGSASTDGGAGALSALGVVLLNSRGAPVADGGAALAEVATIHREGLRAPPDHVVLLTDVTAPLLGPAGSAAVFAPQKGASPSEVAALESSLGRFAHALGGDPWAPGSGAAGGTAYGFATVWGASIVSGADYIARLTGATDLIATADILITGEGGFTPSSLRGKSVGTLMAIAERAGVRVGIIAGSVEAECGTWSISLTELAGSRELAMGHPAEWLYRAGQKAARALGGPDVPA